MWLDAVALLVLGLFAGAGVARGAMAAGMSLVTLFGAYGASLVGASRFGDAVARRLSLPEFAGVAIAGTGAFLAALVLLGALSTMLRRREQRRRRGLPRSARDRFLGAVFGCVRGALVVLLVCYLAIWLDVLRQTGTAEVMPDIADSTAAAVTGSVVEAGVSAAMADSGATGRVVARMAGRPGATLVDLQALVEDPHLVALRSDEHFWTYVEHGAVDTALNQTSFLRISQDAAFRRRLADVGLVDTAAADDAAAFRAEVGDVLREVGPRLHRLRNDPELQRLMQDPEVAAMLRSGNTMGLMTHPGFQQLVARAASAPAPGS